MSEQILFSKFLEWKKTHYTSTLREFSKFINLAYSTVKIYSSKYKWTERVNSIIREEQKQHSNRIENLLNQLDNYLFNNPSQITPQRVREMEEIENLTKLNQ